MCFVGTESWRGVTVLAWPSRAGVALRSQSQPPRPCSPASGFLQPIRLVADVAKAGFRTITGEEDFHLGSTIRCAASWVIGDRRPYPKLSPEGAEERHRKKVTNQKCTRPIDLLDHPVLDDPSALARTSLPPTTHTRSIAILSARGNVRDNRSLRPLRDPL